MANGTVDKFTGGFGWSFAVTTVVSALLVVIKETTGTVKSDLMSLTGHHWVSHGLLMIILFVALGYLLSKWQPLGDRQNAACTVTCAVVAAVALNGLVTVGFYLLH